MFSNEPVVNKAFSLENIFSKSLNDIIMVKFSN